MSSIPIYDWFMEDFGTPVMEGAEALLDQAVRPLPNCPAPSEMAGIFNASRAANRKLKIVSVVYRTTVGRNLATSVPPEIWGKLQGRYPQWIWMRPRMSTEKHPTNAGLLM
jgi:hypothetical protein